VKFKLNNNTNKNIYNFQMSLARVQKKKKKKKKNTLFSPSMSALGIAADIVECHFVL